MLWNDMKEFFFFFVTQRIEIKSWSFIKKKKKKKKRIEWLSKKKAIKKTSFIISQYFIKSILKKLLQRKRKMWLSKHVVSSHLFQLVYLDLECRAILCVVVWLVVFFLQLMFYTIGVFFICRWQSYVFRLGNMLVFFSPFFM